MITAIASTKATITTTTKHCDHPRTHAPPPSTRRRRQVLRLPRRRPFNPAKLEDFLGAIVQVYGPKMLRYKGVLNMKGTDRKVIFQGVHQLMGSDLGPKWAPGEPRLSKMVFIGIDLPRTFWCRGWSSAWSERPSRPPARPGSKAPPPGSIPPVAKLAPLQRRPAPTVKPSPRPSPRRGRASPTSVPVSPRPRPSNRFTDRFARAHRRRNGRTHGPPKPPAKVDPKLPTPGRPRPAAS
jgi:hypothetical protein